MRSHKTTALYESPNRLIRTLYSIEEIFGSEHKMYVGLELTKRHERHLRDSVCRIRETLELESEGSKIKGEITMVIPPSKEDQEYESILKSQSFNPNKDSIVRVNVLTVAQKLNEEVEMHEGEFRDLLKKMFSDIPSYHINTIVRLVKSGGKKNRMTVINDRVGGII